MTRAERETIIRWDSGDRVVTVYTCHRAVWRKAERAGWRQAGECRDRSGRVIGKEFAAPLDQLRFRLVSAEKRASSRREHAARAVLAFARREPST